MGLGRRHFYLLILGQAACVAVGLWMQHHLLCHSIRAAAERHAWSDIEVGAAGLLGKVEGLQLAAPPWNPGALERVRVLLEQARPWQCQVTIVDRHWRPVLQDADPDQKLALPVAPGQPFSWTPSANPAHDVAKPGRGTLHTSDGPHLAVACPLADGAAYLLLHRAARGIQAGPAALLQTLLPIGLVTLLWTLALLSMSTYLTLRHSNETLDRERAQSASDTLRQTQTLIRTRDAVIFALAKLAGFRDHETGGHLERISDYATLLASALRQHPKFPGQVTPAFVRLIGPTSVLHDIGKVGIEDGILRKPGSLTPTERERMQLHAVIAGKCLTEIAQRLGNSNFLQMATEIALAHHEHWDGAGYPNGLKGEEIPLAARIVAIVDVYDALSTPRIYKQALPHEQCVPIIRDGAGRQFDPDLVEVWLTLEPKFREIANRYLNSTLEEKRSRFHAGAWETGADIPDKRDDDTKPPPELTDEHTHVATESAT